VRERLIDVERSFAVRGAKGGVAKSVAVAVTRALAPARRGARVALLDADLHGPSAAETLGLRGQALRVGPGGLRPVRGPYGVRAQIMDFFLQGCEALDWDGAAGEGATTRSALEEPATARTLDVAAVVCVPFDARLAARADAEQPSVDGEGLDSAAGRGCEAPAARIPAFRPELRRDAW